MQILKLNILIILFLFFKPCLAKNKEFHFIKTESSFKLNPEIYSFKANELLGRKGLLAEVSFKKSAKQSFSLASYGTAFDVKKLEDECKGFKNVMSLSHGKTKLSAIKGKKKYKECVLVRKNDYMIEKNILRYYPKLNNIFVYRGVLLNLKKKSEFDSNFDIFIKAHRLWKK